VGCNLTGTIQVHAGHACNHATMQLCNHATMQPCNLTGSIQIQADQCDQIRMSRRHCTMEVVLWETETDDCHRFHMRDARIKRTI
jgi:hypothetical protein